MTAGPRTIAGIDPARRALLDAGTVESTTLTEGLAIDFATLMHSALPDLGEAACATLRQAAGMGIVKRMALAARLILDRHGPDHVTALYDHPSDTVRGWACFAIGAVPGLSLDARLARIRPLADDPHFGVREWAWIAVRPAIADELEVAISALAGWTADPSERIRRFASEATRPRGVWCAHLRPLRERPELGLPILEPLRADPARYVQDSVGNWLNDAGKDRPDWVRTLCARWSANGPTPETARIVRRGLRSLSA